MSVAFQILKDNESACLNEVDKALCEAFHLDFHDKFYGGNKFNWFDSIGFCAAHQHRHCVPLTKYEMSRELAAYYCYNRPRVSDLVELRKALKVLEWFYSQGYSFIRIG